MIYSTRFITRAAVIAVLYAVVTVFLAPISFGFIQFRVSESLMLLAALTPTAIPGLFVGCIMANLYGGYGLFDIVFGSMATFMAALFTYMISQKISNRSRISNNKSTTSSWLDSAKPFLLPLPTILMNGMIVGGYLPFIVPEIRNMSSSLLIVLAMTMGSIMFGETVVTYVIGIPLYYGVKRTRIFRDDIGL